VKTYQLHISINGTEPKVWRRILVKADTLLPELHKIIQIVVGWNDTKLHQFVNGTNVFFFDIEDDATAGYNYLMTKLEDVLVNENDLLLYEYDFNENWIHKIILEKISEDNSYKYPVCLAGKMACPQEDLGGPWDNSGLIENFSFEDNEGGSEPDDDYFDEDEIDYDIDFDDDEADFIPKSKKPAYNPNSFDEDEINKILKKTDFSAII
jgi:hypothetical protein